MTTSFLAPDSLRAAGPSRFVRQIERLLLHLGFTDTAIVDGAGDQGGDLIATRKGFQWVFQVKWKAAGTVGADAVNEVFKAVTHYRADRAAVVTNQRFSRGATHRSAELAQLGARISLWDGVDLLDSFEHLASERLPQHALRPYQHRAFEAVYDDLVSAERGLLILATGLGKTVVGGEIIARHLAESSRAKVLVVAHQTDLVEQLEKALWSHLSKHTKTQLLSGENKPDDLTGVTCATISTATAYVKRGFRPSLLMVDEAHHAAASGNYAELFRLLASTPRFGVTATPWRGDQFDIRYWFGEPSFSLGIEEGMRLGYLADVNYKMFADNIDWDFVVRASEHSYTIKDLNTRLFLPQRDESIRDELVLTWSLVRNPRAIVFCRSVEHAQRMASLFSRVPGWEATRAIHAELGKRERQTRLLQFRKGDIPILTAVDILNEGVDVPDVNIICFARVTHSRRIFVQQLGRGLRLRPGKERVEVLDFVSDIRRVAAFMSIRSAINREEVETLQLDPRNSFQFSDQRVESIMLEWIKDAASIESELDESRLQFPEIFGD